MKKNIYLPDEASTETLAAQIVDALPEDITGWIVLLQGDLGAGKSTLARGMIRAFGHAGTVPSPTYTLIEPYEISGNLIYHIDLYRISSPDELEFLGWSDLADGLRMGSGRSVCRGLQSKLISASCCAMRARGAVPSSLA